jgi:hypothetical protein
MSLIHIICQIAVFRFWNPAHNVSRFLFSFFGSLSNKLNINLLNRLERILLITYKVSTSLLFNPFVVYRTFLVQRICSKVSDFLQWFTQYDLSFSFAVSSAARWLYTSYCTHCFIFWYITNSQIFISRYRMFFVLRWVIQFISDFSYVNFNLLISIFQSTFWFVVSKFRWNNMRFFIRLGFIII